MTKKIKTILTLAISISFLITSCNKSTGPNGDGDSTPEQYTITVINGTGGGVYDKGATATITATIPDGQVFDYWDLAGDKVSEENPYSFVVNEDATFTAHFEDVPPEQYTITVINGTGGGVYDKGATATITATIPDGQVFDYWDLAGDKVSEENPYSFVVNEDATFTAHFEDAPHPMAAYTKNVYKKSDKDFKVLSLTDIQLHDGEKVDVTLDVIDQLVEKEQPDMIVHVGDLLNDNEVYASLNNYVTVLDKIDSYDIPWAAVLGNHDYETYQAGYDSKKTTTSEQLMTKFLSYENCVVSYGPNSVEGKSNFIVNVLDENTNQLVHSLYFLDSGLNGVKDSHATFYRDAVAYSTLLNNNQPVKSSLYVHIPLPEYGDVLEVSKPMEYRDLVGSYNRNPCDLAAGSRKVFEAIEELGVTENVFCGHDHDNAYYGYYHGVRLAYSMKSSDGDHFNNPAEIGGAILKIGEDVDFYYSKADIQFETDGDLNVSPDLLPYWRYSGATVNFDIEMLGSSGTIKFSLLGTNTIRYSVDEQYRYGAWNRLTAQASIDVASKSVNYGTLTQVPNSNKYHYSLDVDAIPLNDNSGEVACGDETMRLIYFFGGSDSNKFRISNVYYEFESVTETDQIDLANATIDAIPDQYYNFSQAIRPDLTVKVNDVTLNKVDDILITYENNIEVGEATVKVVPSAKGTHRYKGEKTATFNIVVNPDGDTVPGHENATVVNSSAYTIEGGGLKPVNNWKNSGKAFYFEIKRMVNGSLQNGETFRFSLLGNNSNPGHMDSATGNWNRLTTFYYLEFANDSLTVHKSGSETNIAIVNDLGDRWFGVTIPYSAFDLNESGEGAMGNENETFTLCYITNITRSFRIDNIDSMHAV